MKTGFDRNVDSIELFGKTYRIASTTLATGIRIDLVDTDWKDEVPEHRELHKMLLTVENALSINHTEYNFLKNPFGYLHYRKCRRLFSYTSLRDNMDIQTLVRLVTIIGKLNSIPDTNEKKKKESK